MTAPTLIRFFFHVVGDGQDHRDEEGEVFASVQAARTHAVQIANELRHDTYRGCAVCVTNAEGQEIARVPIDGAI
jgi:hypothetical protein